MDLLLIGKTGNGKSSTGNSILGWQLFDVSDSSDSVTQKCQLGHTELDGREVRVVDTPGLCDTREKDKVKAYQHMCDVMADAMTQYVQGFHALILVLKYNDRFTSEDLSVIDKLKSIFGEKVLSECGIIVFTMGECFDINNEETGKTFADWCDEQEGDLKTLLETCGHRTLLFHNRSKSKRQSQCQQLLSMVDGLSSAGQRYTNDDFKQAESLRNRKLVEEKFPYLNEKISKNLDKLLKQMDEIKNLPPSEDDSKKVQDIISIVDENEAEIKSEDNGTDVLASLLTQVENARKMALNIIDLKNKKADEEDIENAMRELNKIYTNLKNEKSEFSSNVTKEFEELKNFFSKTFFRRQAEDPAYSFESQPDPSQKKGD